MPKLAPKDLQVIADIRAAQPKVDAALNAGRFAYFVSPEAFPGESPQAMLDHLGSAVRTVLAHSRGPQTMRILVTYDEDIR